MNELIRTCLDLPENERARLASLLSDSLRKKKTDNKRFDILLEIATEVVGDGILSRTKDFNCVMGRRMIAYQMRKEGFSLNQIGRRLNRNHTSVLHMEKMMDDIFRFPGVFKVEEEYWNEFKRKIDAIDKRTDQGS